MDRWTSWKMIMAVVLVASTQVIAASPAGQGKGSKVLESVPVKILSDSLKVLQKQHAAIFSGNVRATQGDLHISCKKLTVSYSSSRAGKSAGKILSMLFAGDVIITQGHREGHCEQARYSKTESRLVCTGDPWVIDGQSKVHGDEIIYFLDKDEVRVKRPRAVLDVSDKTEQDDK